MNVDAHYLHRRTWLALVVPLLAILIAVSIGHQHGAAWTFAPNVFACALGATLVVALRGVRLERVAFASVLLLAATLLFTTHQEVARWLPIGPFILYVGPITAPLVLRSRSVLLITAASVVHVLQPDARLAIALSVGTLFTVVLRPRRDLWLAFAATAVAAAISCCRTDTLPTLPYVEGILALVAEQSLVLSVLSKLVFVALIGVYVRLGDRTEGVPLAAHFATCVVLAETFNSPIPVIGAGAGHVLGWYAGVYALGRREPRA